TTIAAIASANAQSERSDVTAVPAMGVIAEAMAAIVVANAVLEKFGADTTKDILKAVDGYLRRIEERWESAGQTSDT
ncbi:MAG: chorismate synthase, partial [Gemmatimonadota bacterium]|nr:chorismate synthase [Gemmatimonadota bacterium]